jgi:ElaB/YqjD/DUF883 family membrane-anchored ribosome-binding protein
MNASSSADTDVNTAIGDAQRTLQRAATATGDVAEHLVGRASDQLASVAAKLREMRTAAVETGKAAAHVTDDYVHESPWLAIASAACVGVVIGLLISRR